MGDRTDLVQLGTGHHVSVGEGQRRVALQRRVAAYLVGGGQTPGATQRCLNPGFSERIGNSRRTGVQWGVLSDGNRYVLYNSLGGASFEEQRFLTLEIKTIDTDSGFTMEEFLKHLTSLLSRECLENEDIQQAYEEHMINNRVRLALDSLLSTPFDTLCSAIRREFQEERVGLPEGIKISKKHIDAYLVSIADEAGRIPVDLEAEVIHTDDAVQDSALESSDRATGGTGPCTRQAPVYRGSVAGRTRP